MMAGDDASPSGAPETGVRAWAEPVVIPTYPLAPPDRNPMFLEKRVYQGSSGRVYPNRIIDRVLDVCEDRTWQAIHLENDLVSLMLLPEIGGRIQVGRDRTNGYDFFYRQPVIKPALVGLLGPWISGGVEFNWPQHHRPSTFMPVDWAIEEEPDGGRIVWMGDHEPMNRMKGMVGIRLRPGSSLVEARVRLANRTPHTQTFLWWANVAVRVNERYQSFFPSDVRSVADHARRATSAFPVARGRYYGVDYGARPPEAADLSWYANIPVPTSYMAVGSREDFFGGYDHEAGAGLVHIADHRVAPGKKQWTWGDAAFGRAWERNLTDGGGPYIELMAGVYTDNQPDFSYLAPYETRTFTQAWYPIRDIGPVLAANRDAAVSVRRDAAAVAIEVGVNVTRAVEPALVVVTRDGAVLAERRGAITPAAPLRLALPAGLQAGATLDVVVRAADGRELIRASTASDAPAAGAVLAAEPPAPANVPTIEELYLTAVHLEQYRHATRLPGPYWAEALRRDPTDVRTNTAVGVMLLRAGRYADAERHLRTAVDRVTRRNANPGDGEPFYQIGLCLALLGRDAEAEESLAKATWSRAWQAPAEHALAQLRARAGDLRGALARADRALDADPRHATAVALKAALLRHQGDDVGALAVVAAGLAVDPLDRWLLAERRRLEGPGPGDLPVPAAVLGQPATQAALDIAHEYAAAGLLADAEDELAPLVVAAEGGPSLDPMVAYTVGWIRDRLGDPDGAAAWYRRAAALPADGCFPARLVEIEILLAASAAVPSDPRAPYYLGNLYYDRRRYADAIACWRTARALDPGFPTVHRNLGIAQANVLRAPGAAERSFLRAFACDPTDARVLYELDQLQKRRGASPAARLRRLERQRDLVALRDDLGVEMALLLEQVRGAAAALAHLSGRRFHPWEGGEGLALDAHTGARLRLGRAALLAGDAAAAIGHLDAALEPPETLGEARHPLDPEHELWFELGRARQAAGDAAGALAAWGRAASPLPAGAELHAAAAFRGLALVATGRHDDGALAIRGLLHATRRAARKPVGIDFFATSLPTFLVFEDDLDRRHRLDCRWLEGVALGALGRTGEASDVLAEVLAADPSHMGALRALDRIAGEPPPASPPGTA